VNKSNNKITEYRAIFHSLVQLIQFYDLFYFSFKITIFVMLIPCLSAGKDRGHDQLFQDHVQGCRMWPHLSTWQKTHW